MACGGLFWLVILQPCPGLSTREVFGRFRLDARENRPDTQAAATALAAGDWRGLCRSLGNVLQGVSAELRPEIGEGIAQAIDADMKYMHENGVLDADGNAGDCYYEDDEAFEYMVEALVDANTLTPEQAVKVASLLDDYMDIQQAYLESKGLVDWE